MMNKATSRRKCLFGVDYSRELDSMTLVRSAEAGSHDICYSSWDTTKGKRKTQNEVFFLKSQSLTSLLPHATLCIAYLLWQVCHVILLEEFSKLEPSIPIYEHMVDIHTQIQMRLRSLFSFFFLMDENK